jgi:hypothetical protein
MRGKQGTQGSYNQVRETKLVDELKRFGRSWVKGMVQELNYNGREMSKWRTFAGSASTK